MGDNDPRHAFDSYNAHQRQMGGQKHWIGNDGEPSNVEWSALVVVACGMGAGAILFVLLFARGCQ